MLALNLEILDGDRSTTTDTAPRVCLTSMVKEIGKKVSKNEKKKPERPQRSVSKRIDEDVIQYTCGDACVKVANVKTEKYSNCSPGGRSQAPTRTLLCPEFMSRGAPNNRLWSPWAYGLMGQ